MIRKFLVFAIILVLAILLAIAGLFFYYRPTVEYLRL